MHKFAPHNLTLDFTSRNPKVRHKKFCGSFPMTKKVNENRKESEMLISLWEPIYKIPHKVPLLELKKKKTQE